MCQLFVFAVMALMHITNIQPAHPSLLKDQQKRDSVFAHKDNADLYWEALIQAANGNKEEALKIAEAIKNNTPITIVPTWQDDQPQHIDAFFNKLFLASVFGDPQMLSLLGLFESIGIREHNKQLTDVSAQALLQRLEEAQENWHRLNQYSCEGLSHDQKISYKIFAWMLHHAVAGEKFLFHEYKINQLDGILTELTALFTQFHTLEDAEDIENYLTRLSSIPSQFQQAIDFLELQKDKGILMPRFAIEKVIAIIKALIPEHRDKNIFYARLEQHIHKIPLQDRKSALEKAQQAIKYKVYPAYQLLQEYFTQLLDDAQTNHGAWALPNGDEYYAYMLQRHTTTNLSADEIHALGIQEVEKIYKEMREILAHDNMNDPHKSVGILVQELSKNPEFYYPNTDVGREQCLARYQAILERSRKELAHLFELKPQAGVTIQRVPTHEEDGSAAAYYLTPSIDGSRPGIFFANLRNMAEIPTYGMETLTIHEAEPGHHFQISLQCEMNIPMLRKLGNYTAYVEGWALYAEKLAYEQGFYSSSFAKLGHLQDELLRAARLVVDTGIHHKRWTREQAIAYMEETTGYHHDTSVSEVERYFVLPGQACAYKIGQLKILELRQRAKEMLGDAFDIKTFHNVILGAAAVPLVILEEIVDHYIQENNQ